MSVLLTAADFTRLEPGNPGPRQLSDGWCMTDCRDWGRFISKRTFKMPLQIDIEAQVHTFYAHSDARPYDGMSFLWGHPTSPNDRNFNINMLKRDQSPSDVGARWQEEIAAHKYAGRGGYQRMIPWTVGSYRLFQFLLTDAPPVTDTKTQPSNHALTMHVDGQRWDGYTVNHNLRTGRILIRADRCLAQWRVRVTEGSSMLVERLAGSDRFGSAGAISRARFGSGRCEVAYLAGENGVDALPASPLAAEAPGPILYVQKNALPKAAADELRRLRPGKLVVLGGQGVISDAVVEQAKAAAQGQ